MDEIKISVVIPCYNTEKYIEQCLNSIIKQQYKNLEIIAVDDGSTDNTLNILKQYQKKYKIKVIQTEHQGVSVARNKAMKTVSGKYIMFLDSDDYVQSNVFAYINKMANKNIDCFVSEFDSLSEIDGKQALGSEKLDAKRINNKPLKNVLNYFYSLRLIHTMWRFIVKKEVIVKNSLYLTSGIIHEDEEWVTKMLISVGSIHKIPFRFYVYRKRRGSIMNQQSLEHYYSMMKISQGLIKDIKNIDEDYKKLYYLRETYKLCELCYYGIKQQANPDN